MATRTKTRSIRPIGQVGFLLTLGADYRLWKGALVGEVRIPFATVGQKTTGDSNVGAVAVVLGYRLRI